MLEKEMFYNQYVEEENNGDVYVDDEYCLNNDDVYADDEYCLNDNDDCYFNNSNDQETQQNINNKNKHLTQEEEKNLFIKMSNGDKKAFNNIVNINIGLVYKIAQKYLNSGVNKEDLIVEGELGLMEAVKKFKLDKGNRFSTYAYRYINGYILNYIRENSKLMKIPQNLYSNILKLNKLEEEYCNEYGKYPTDEQLADYSKEFTVKRIREIRTSIYTYSSLDEPIYFDTDTAIGETIAAEETDQFEESEEELQIQDLHTALNMLPINWKKTLEYMFYTESGEKMTLEKIGEKLGVSKETVRQYKEKGLDRLREIMTGLQMQRNSAYAN